MSTSCEFAQRWMLQNTFDVKSTLVQVMVWCRQAASHYLNLCWLRSISPWVTRPKWVKLFLKFHQLKHISYTSNIRTAVGFRPVYHSLMQKRCNSIALAMELHLFCIKPLIPFYCIHQDKSVLTKLVSDIFPPFQWCIGVTESFMTVCLLPGWLWHWYTETWTKWLTILQTFSNAFSWNECYFILIKMSMQFLV